MQPQHLGLIKRPPCITAFILSDAVSGRKAWAEIPVTWRLETKVYDCLVRDLDAERCGHLCVALFGY